MAYLVDFKTMTMWEPGTDPTKPNEIPQIDN